MSITDELRKWGYGFCGDTHDVVTAIADRIDAEHQKQVTDAFTKGAIDGIDMAEHSIEYVKLPVDADGVPIHVGDVMEYTVCPSVHREVTGVGVECFYGWENGNGRYSQFSANCYRHHHAQTVEDVLREFAYGLGVPVADSYVAATAAKLRLAGDAE